MSEGRWRAAPLFVTADELVTVLDRACPGHDELAELWRLFLEPDAVLVTSDWSVVKASLALQARHGRAGLEALHLRCLPALRVERCRPDDLERGLAVLLRASPCSRWPASERPAGGRPGRPAAVPRQASACREGPPSGRR